MNNFIGKQLKDNEFLSSTKKVIKDQMRYMVNELYIRLDNISKHNELIELREEIRRQEKEINECHDKLENQQNEEIDNLKRMEEELKARQNREEQMRATIERLEQIAEQNRATNYWTFVIGTAVVAVGTTTIVLGSRVFKRH